MKSMNAYSMVYAAVCFIYISVYQFNFAINIDNTRAELHALLSQKLSSTFRQVDETYNPHARFSANAVNADKSQRTRRNMVSAPYRKCRQTIMCSAMIPQKQ